VVGIVGFVIIAASAVSSLRDPPFWDGAVGVFPAARFLVSHGFDWGLLLRQPRYFEGGPNVHALSLVTAYTAVVLWLAGSTARALPVLHVVTWLWGAIGIAAFVRLARRRLPPGLSLALAGLLLACPVVMVQLRQTYLEIPLLCLGVLAVLSFERNARMTAALLTFLAAAVKANGAIFAFALGLCSLASRGTWGRRVGMAALFVFPAAAWSLLGVGFSIHGGASTLGPLGRIASAFGMVYRLVLVDIPDLTVLWAAALLVAIAWGLGRARAWLRREATGPGTGPAEPAASTILIVLLSVLFHFVVFPQIAVDFVFLPRYIVAYLPFLLLAVITWLLRVRCPPRLLTALVVVAGVLGLANRQGDLYGVPTWPCPAMAERSLEYQDVLATYREGVRDGLAGVPDDATILVGLPEHYLLSSPDQGYTDRHFANLELARGTKRVGDEPLVVILGYPWLGGEHARATVKAARMDPEKTVQFRYQGGHGWYRFIVAEIRSRGAAMGAAPSATGRDGAP